MTLSSLLQGLWSPKLDRYNSWEKSRWRSSPGACNIITMGSCDFQKYLLICTSWVHEYLRYKCFLKSHDQVYSDDGEEYPCCSPLQSYTCSLCWSTETSPEWRYLQYCFIKLIFQSDTVLYLYLFKFYSICVMSVCKQKVSIISTK